MKWYKAHGNMETYASRKVISENDKTRLRILIYEERIQSAIISSVLWEIYPWYFLCARDKYHI